MTQTIILGSERAAKEAVRVVIAAPKGAVLTVKPPKRTLDQNAKMHAMLSDISRAKPDGRTLTPDVWKALFLHAMDHSIRFEHALDGQGMVPIGFRSSKLSKEQFSDLIMTIQEYGDRHGVEWTEPASVDERSQSQDPQGLGPEAASAVGEAETPNPSSLRAIASQKEQGHG